MHFPRDELDHVNFRTWAGGVAFKKGSPQPSFQVLVNLAMMLPI